MWLGWNMKLWIKRWNGKKENKSRCGLGEIFFYFIWFIESLDGFVGSSDFWTLNGCVLIHKLDKKKERGFDKKTFYILSTWINCNYNLIREKLLWGWWSPTKLLWIRWWWLGQHCTKQDYQDNEKGRERVTSCEGVWPRSTQLQ